MLDLAIITARGGSVGVPGKNVRLLGGYPLIEWTIRAAQRSGCFRRIVVSTDSEQIAEASLHCGAEVPFMRPADLATDAATSVDVVKHVLAEIGAVEHFGLLQPTSPFRSASHVREAYSYFVSSGAPSLISLAKGKPLHWNFHLDDARRLLPVAHAEQMGRRQDTSPVFYPNGALYLCRSEPFVAASRFYLPDSIGYEMGAIDSIDIDDHDDFALTEAIVDRGLRTIDR